MRHTLSRGASYLAILTALTAASSQARAQAIALDAAALPDSSPSIPGTGLPSGVRATVGASILSIPRFEGSAKYKLTALPSFEFAPIGGSSTFSALSRFDINAPDDVSFTAYSANGFSLGPLTGIRASRNEASSPRLMGMGDVKGGMIAGAFAKYDRGPWFVRTSLHQDIANAHTGYVLRLAAGTKYPVSDRIIIKTDLTADFADQSYMDRFFGVTPQQAATSSHAVFKPSAGLKSTGILLSTDYKLTADWTLLAATGYTRLLGDAAKSPIIETANRYEFRLGATRSFDWSFR
jgi:MipA family protein